MTGSEQLFGDPESIGRRLKTAIRETTGGLRLPSNEHRYLGMKETDEAIMVGMHMGKYDARHV